MKLKKGERERKKMGTLLNVNGKIRKEINKERNETTAELEKLARGKITKKGRKNKTYTTALRHENNPSRTPPPPLPPLTTTIH